MRIFFIAVSYTLNYYSLVPVFLAAGIFKTGLSAEQIRVCLPLLLLLDIIIPLSIFGYLVKTKRIPLNLIKRQNRPLPYGIFTFFILAGTIFSLIFANPLFLKIHLIFLILTLTNFLVTFFFKISGHMLMNTSIVIILNFLFGWTLLWLFPIIPLVAFARLYLRAHTKWEVAVGTIVGFLEPYLFLKIFKLL